jgi:hypothetical protein
MGWSPVLFSLPSEMGFSRELLQDDLRTRLTFNRANATENFLAVDLSPQQTGPQILPEKLMLTESIMPTPQPLEGTVLAEKRAARRVYVAPELKDRLVGGVVLPPELNKPLSTSWAVRAEISVSAQGQVRHVLLEEPLESSALNQEVIRLLYGLHFRSAPESVDGSIEIYSSAESTAEGDK